MRTAPSVLRWVNEGRPQLSRACEAIERPERVRSPTSPGVEAKLLWTGGARHRSDPDAPLQRTSALKNRRFFKAATAMTTTPSLGRP